jgi:hypothetical protein
MDRQNFKTWLNVELSKRNLLKKHLIEEMQDQGCRDSYSSLINQFNGFHRVKTENESLIRKIFDAKQVQQ